MWKALIFWGIGGLLGLVGGYYALGANIPERLLPMSLLGGVMGCTVGAMLGAVLIIKGLDEKIVLGLIGKPTRSFTSREELIRSVPGIAMACVAMVSIPTLAAYFFGLVLLHHLFVAVSVGAWATAWIGSGARRLPSGIVFILLLWTSATTALIAWAQAEHLGLGFYLQSEATMLVSNVLGLIILRFLVVSRLGREPQPRSDWG